MTDFTIHTVESAPQKGKPLLEKSQQAFGRIPNLHGVMAESPEHLHGYQVLHEAFLNSSFNNDEKTVVWQAINVEHECHYCVPAHSAIAKSMKVSDELVKALREQAPLGDEKLEVLRTTTLEMLRERGKLSDAQTKAFFAAGYTKQNLLEIILALSQKVMSNYVNHIAHTPLDDAFKTFK
ncbi:MULTISPECIES: carboxymuconolactone decarboxylase family protein [unclassified Pseudoalteromonas]|uniref:carboxymuconolactone decarboxylase family protein n=1 Tax=unclassified Pseudoalteromonas TaxID=194690 RepID=UPI001F42D2AF|nr:MULTISPECIES: carboxymuconolactone decarboxylase family protein [unclassified Pseudoalteromonas]MCF2828336.1 carboxymuconolactone decarboxylase family protein [Pseudoalteromonas sp. OF5H-5]MCF2830557.1 carboxymuconolactone decarboxylase family protein [Pseudoalteromonas sp. DL2-H6]MCF2924424.1 carboxymuconolactone decarboxylase family protein [Pseudoalteromonas sp. DL2-H1]